AAKIHSVYKDLHNVSCKIILSSLSTVSTDLLSGRRRRITVDRLGALDSVTSLSGLGDLGALVVLCVPWVDS
ncbi:hypothetical protein Tco_1358659, partial [Tanacetum coccineum]